MLFMGWSGSVFVATRYTAKDNGDGTAMFSASEKFDVTEQFDEIAAKRAKFVRATKRKAAKAKGSR